MGEEIIKSEYFTRDGVPYIRVVVEGTGFEMPLAEFLIADLPDLFDRWRKSKMSNHQSNHSSNTT